MTNSYNVSYNIPTNEYISFVAIVDYCSVLESENSNCIDKTTVDTVIENFTVNVCRITKYFDAVYYNANRAL